MKPVFIRRHRRRNTAAKSDAAFFKKDSQETFFGGGEHDSFFQPATTTAAAQPVQRKCDECESEEKEAQRQPDKKEEEQKVMKAPDDKEEDVQRAPEKKEDEEKKVQKAPEKKEEDERKVQKAEEKKEEDKVQKKESNSSTSNHKNVSNYIGSLNGKGHALSPAANKFFSSKMGYDFSDVRIHTDKQAAESAKGINAKAFATGNDIVFNEGQYNMDSIEGKKLMAHELTHVRQQRPNGGQAKQHSAGSVPASVHTKPKVQRKPEVAEVPALWHRLSGELSYMAGQIGLINLKTYSAERSDLSVEVWTLSGEMGEPGEKSDAELLLIEKRFTAFKSKLKSINTKNQDGWFDVFGKYQTEEKRLGMLIDEPESIKALELLRKEMKDSMRRVELAEDYLVYEDYMPLKYMLDNKKHISIAQAIIGHGKKDRGEVYDSEDTSSWVEHVSDVNVSIGIGMTSEAGLRELYQKMAREITLKALEDIKKGIDPAKVARWAVNARNDLKVVIRSKGSSIVKGLAEFRNVRKYGNKIGPSYEELIKKGNTPEKIIGKAPNVKVNKFGSKLKIGGRVLFAVSIAVSAWEVFNAPEGQRLRTAVREGGGIIGAIAGGWAGAKAGGAGGSFFGPVGTFIGGVGGFIGGALLGGFLGREVAEATYDFIDDLTTPTDELDAFYETIDAAEHDRILNGK